MIKLAASAASLPSEKRLKFYITININIKLIIKAGRRGSGRATTKGLLGGDVMAGACANLLLCSEGSSHKRQVVCMAFLVSCQHDA